MPDQPQGNKQSRWIVIAIIVVIVVVVGIASYILFRGFEAAPRN